MADMTVGAPAPVHAAEGSHLKGGELNLLDSTVIATSSVAPAYSLGTTLFLVIAATGVGLASPAAVLVSFFPVFCIALAYYYMNREDPNCGASYSWIARSLNPFVGWFSGWVQLAANVLFCISAPIFAGATLLTLLNQFGWINSDAAASTNWAAIVGFLMLSFVAFLVVRGIRVTADFQWVMVGIEYLVVLGFSIAGLIKAATSHPAGSIDVGAWWFNPFSIQGLDGLAAGAVLGVFFFWGWDTAANLNEETKDGRENPGKAGLISMFILLVLFLLSAAAVQALLGPDQIATAGVNTMTVFAGAIAPTPISYLMAVAILASSLATTQTTLLPSSRLSLSMARDHVLPAVFRTIHPTWLTPWVGTLITFALASIGIALTTLSSSIGSTFTNIITSIGVLVAIYYGLTGIACAWAFRRVLLKRPSVLFLAGVLPVLGALFLFWIGFKVVQFQWTSSGFSAAAPVLVIVALGVPGAIAAGVFNKTGFFKQKTISYDEVGGSLRAETKTA